MSRWARDPEDAADDLIGKSLGDIDVRGRLLVANQMGRLPALLAAQGVDCTVWNRRKTATASAQPWPPAGPFDVAFLRLPKAKDEQEMAAHACLSVLGADGRLVVYGGNDEGIRSAGSLLGGLCGPVETVAARGHGRVIAARRPADMGRVRGSLSDWRAAAPLEIAGRVRDWISYPGLFAAGRIDEGTALLLGALPPLPASARVLDYGCGSGLIGAAMQAAVPGVAVDLMDNDAVALEAARENVAGARLLLCDALAGLDRKAYDAILSNPPLHAGFAENLALLEQLIAGAPAHLAPTGRLLLVVQRRVALGRLLAKNFDAVSVPAENGRYRVWRAARARPAARR
jgi:16S rRNA (guanine1207-N2)-methyltransferase